MRGSSRALWRPTVPVFVAAIWLLGAQVSLAQFVGVQYGPRAFSTAPKGTHALSLTFDKMNLGIGVDGILLSDIENDSRAVFLNYLHFFSLGGKTSLIQFSLPYVDIESTVNTTCCGTFPGLEESGVTDPFVQFNVALLGGPALSPKEFFQREPGWVMVAHTGIRLPFGEYNSSSPLNVGANRFEYRFGLPVSYIWGTPTKQTTVEFAPVFYFFMENDDPYGGGRTSQDPVLQLEAHVTRDLAQAVYVALNGQYVIGGETTTDGVPADNALDYASFGVSVGVRLSRSLGANLTYARRLYAKNTQHDGGLWRAGLTYTFMPKSASK